MTRKIKHWKATEGPSKETIFPQVHYPGDLCGIDYTHMDELGITIKKEIFNHLIFHFVLTSSNWETGNICYSESLESLIDGLQRALWELGGVPKRLRSDNLTAAIKISSDKKTFTDRFAELLKHYNLEGVPINAGKPQENGDVEQRNNRFKKAVEQALILRGSRDFDSIDEYNNFLQKLLKQLNQGRREKFLEEIPKLQSLPKTKLDNFKETYRRIGPSSTLVISHNTYSVHSRLIGEQVKVRLKASTIELYLGSKKVEEFPRLRGSGGHKINYRHIIDSLIRKPGAFENYRYKDDLFPTVHFRMAFDTFKKENPTKSPRDYLQLLKLSADEGETKVDNAIREIFNSKQKLTLENIKQSLKTTLTVSIPEIYVSSPSLAGYNNLLVNAGGLYG